jgi:hypothetical protein
MTGWSDASSIALSNNNTVIGARTYMYNSDISNPLMGVNVFKVDLGTKQVIWDKTYRIYNSVECYSLHQALGVEITPNNDIIVSGTANLNFAFLLKLNTNGDSLWTKSYKFENLASQVNDLIITDDGGFMGVGFVSDPNAGWTGWMFKTDSNGVVSIENDEPSSASGSHVSVYPNPATTHIIFDWESEQPEKGILEIYNAMGILIKKVNIESGKHTLSIEGLASGVYLYKIKIDPLRYNSSSTSTSLEPLRMTIGSGKFVVE